MNRELDGRSFEARWRALVAGQRAAAENHGCIECVNCRGCNGSTFCRDSDQLVRSHFCVGCGMCSDCSHCRTSKHLSGCQHCVDAENCSFCSYLVRCVAMTASSYCFGCVGLSGVDFHILNQPYERDAYFATVRRLLAELRG